MGDPGRSGIKATDASLQLDKQGGGPKMKVSKKVLGHFGKPQYSLLTDAVLTLEVIEEKDNEKAVYVPKHMVLKRASLNSSDFSENF